MFLWKKRTRISRGFFERKQNFTQLFLWKESDFAMVFLEKESKIPIPFDGKKTPQFPANSWERKCKILLTFLKEGTLTLMIFLEKGKLQFPVTCLWKKRLCHPMGGKIPVGLSGMYSITRTRSFYLSALCAYYYDLCTNTFFLPVCVFVISFSPQFMLHVISWKRRPTLWRCCHPTFQSRHTQ